MQVYCPKKYPKTPTKSMFLDSGKIFFYEKKINNKKNIF